MFAKVQGEPHGTRAGGIKSVVKNELLIFFPLSKWGGLPCVFLSNDTNL